MLMLLFIFSALAGFCRALGNATCGVDLALARSLGRPSQSPARRYHWRHKDVRHPGQRPLGLSRSRSGAIAVQKWIHQIETFCAIERALVRFLEVFSHLMTYTDAAHCVHSGTPISRAFCGLTQSTTMRQITRQTSRLPRRFSMKREREPLQSHEYQAAE